MALPISTTPVYTLTVPSSGEIIKFRPFLVKEEKALLIAQQSADETTMIDTLKGVIKSCVKTELDVDKIAIFDLEYIFAQIRAKSVGELVDLIFSCDVCNSDKAKVKITFDLTKLAVHFPAGHSSKIDLDDGLGIKMRYPDLSMLKQRDTSGADITDAFAIICDCIDFIYTPDEVYHARDQSRAELLEFIENLTSKQFEKLQSFFETMPKLQQAVDYKCPVCGAEHHRYLEGISSFF